MTLQIDWIFFLDSCTQNKKNSKILTKVGFMLHPNNHFGCSKRERVRKNTTRTGFCLSPLSPLSLCLLVTACFTDPDNIAILLRADPGFQFFGFGPG